MRALWFAAVLALCACETSETKAWKARRDALNREVAALELLRIDSHARGRFAVMRNDMLALEQRFDVVGTARAADAGVKATQEEQGVVLLVDGTLAQCRDALRALAPYRALTLRWRLRIDGGACHWSGTETPALHAWRLEVATPPTPWKPPPAERLSRGVEALKLEVRDIEAQGAAHRAELGALAAMPELEYRYRRASALVPMLDAAQPPCDLAILERAVETGDGSLLEVSSEALVHPLEPLADPRLKGLADRSSGALRWSCPR